MDRKRQTTRRRPRSSGGAIDEQLWAWYCSGYTQLAHSGGCFPQLVRPRLSHIAFTRTLPALRDYARLMRDDADFPNGMGGQIDGDSVAVRDLLHMDYAISLGYSGGSRARDVLTCPAPELFSAFDGRLASGPADGLAPEDDVDGGAGTEPDGGYDA